MERKPGIRTTEGRPRRYYYTTKSLEEEAGVADDRGARESPKEQILSVPDRELGEADLYPLFCRYLLDEFKIFSMRIDDRRSTNNRGPNGNRWLFPDVVGLEDFGAEWDRDVVDTVRELAEKKTKIWSFELKLRLNPANLRESFFQAVSNSTWADFGYLVASEIQGGSTMDELRILSSLHGIGVIRFDAENPSESQILIPANDHDSVDWSTVDRLVTQNPDFRNFVKLVRQFYQTGETHPALWGL